MNFLVFLTSVSQEAGEVVSASDSIYELLNSLFAILGITIPSAVYLIVKIVAIIVENSRKYKTTIKENETLNEEHQIMRARISTLENKVDTLETKVESICENSTNRNIKKLAKNQLIKETTINIVKEAKPVIEEFVEEERNKKKPSTKGKKAKIKKAQN